MYILNITTFTREHRFSISNVCLVFFAKEQKVHEKYIEIKAYVHQLCIKIRVGSHKASNKSFYFVKSVYFLNYICPNLLSLVKN